MPQVVGLQPPRFQCGSFPRCELPLATPKAVHPLLTWLTCFEDYEDELVAEFCPLQRNPLLPFRPRCLDLWAQGRAVLVARLAAGIPRKMKILVITSHAGLTPP